MKQIAMVAAALALSAGAAFAATPGNSSTTNQSMNQPATNRPMSSAQAQRSDWRANQETRALNLLEAQGFANFRDFHRTGHDQYAANVVEAGHPMTVHVNPQDGQITRG